MSRYCMECNMSGVARRAYTGELMECDCGGFGYEDPEQQTDGYPCEGCGGEGYMLRDDAGDVQSCGCGREMPKFEGDCRCECGAHLCFGCGNYVRGETA